jgi:hypothetical protein
MIFEKFVHLISSFYTFWPFSSYFSLVIIESSWILVTRLWNSVLLFIILHFITLPSENISKLTLVLFVLYKWIPFITVICSIVSLNYWWSITNCLMIFFGLFPSQSIHHVISIFIPFLIVLIRWTFSTLLLIAIIFLYNAWLFFAKLSIFLATSVRT